MWNHSISLVSYTLNGWHVWHDKLILSKSNQFNQKVNKSNAWHCLQKTYYRCWECFGMWKGWWPYLLLLDKSIALQSLKGPSNTRKSYLVVFLSHTAKTRSSETWIFTQCGDNLTDLATLLQTHKTFNAWWWEGCKTKKLLLVWQWQQGVKQDSGLFWKV